MRCCFPASQFTISKSTSSGTVRIDGPLRGRHQPLAILEEAYEAYDYDNGRIASYMIRRFLNGYPEQHLRIVEDLEKEIVWIIYPYEQKCVKGKAADYPFHPDRCVSEYAEYLGASYVDDKAVYTDTWGVFIPGSEEYPYNAYYSITYGNDSCIPHGTLFAGVSEGWDVKQHLVSNSGYYNYEEGIDEPDAYFGLPDYCEEKPRKNGGGAGRPGRPDRPSKGRRT
ncbi:development-specific protein LVN1.2-like [Amphiura filiformis]|uniref:development-specific protein LVN1.2-like n=1 Tax=Amphiura filiformis TaxID=82378 RepID=UPI003B216AB6